MDKLFQKIIDNNFADLKDLTADLSIPVPQRLINEIIQSTLQGNKNIAYRVVTILGENKVSVNLKTTLWPWPLDLKLRLERSADLTGTPKIRARLENNLLLGKLGSLFKALPDWININGDQVVVDIESFFTREQKKYLDLIKSIDIKTEPGRVIFDVKVKID